MASSTPRNMARPIAACARSYVLPTRSRPFSTGIRLCRVPPESPDYIEVHQPPQPSYPERTPIKGILPVPRDILTNRAKKDKTSDEFLGATIRSPKPSNNASAKDDKIRAWKQRLSSTRRANLEESVKAIKARQTRDRERRSLRAQYKHQARVELLNREEPEDSILTSPTVSKEIRDYLNGGAKPLPQSPEEIALRKQKYQERQALIAERRRDSIHTLYVEARSFILNEEQLNEAITAAFGADDNPVQLEALNGNPWNHGPPENIKEMLERGNTTQRNITQLTNQRLRRISEELTGGRIPPPIQEA